LVVVPFVFIRTSKQKKNTNNKLKTMTSFFRNEDHDQIPFNRKQKIMTFFNAHGSFSQPKEREKKKKK
jgi:hypothetical protein